MKGLDATLGQITSQLHFRCIGYARTLSGLTAKSDGLYTCEVSKPEKGWTAFFIELTYPSANQDQFKFTTEVRVVPDVLPGKFVPKGPPK